MREDDLPALYRAADGASSSGQTRYLRLTRIELTLILAGAGASSVRLLGDPSGAASATAVAIILVAALVLRLANRISRSNKIWFDGRAVAESVKTATWRFTMHLDPYSGGDAESGATFLHALREMLQERPDLAAHMTLDAAGEAITPAMRAFRRLPASERRDRYIQERLQDQLDWYRGRSEANRKMAAVWFWTGLAAQACAAAVAIVAVTIPPLFTLIGFLSAVAAAATAWAQLGRHDELGRSYGMAAHELMILRSALQDADVADLETVTDLVRDAEGAISREHTMWIAKRS